jgi:hypothetical protein
MSRWSTALRIGDKELKLLVTDPEGNDLLKARLPVLPPHRRALLTLLEGVALWSGEPLCAAISAGARRDDWIIAEEWGDEFWPPESPLVHFDYAISPRTCRRLVGLGDFHGLRRHLRMVGGR